jgi:hypothetical protein
MCATVQSFCSPFISWFGLTIPYRIMDVNFGLIFSTTTHSKRKNIYNSTFRTKAWESARFWSSVWPSTDINSHQLISTLINWYQLSSTDINSHHLISTLINWYQLSSTDINSHQLLSTLINWYQLSSTDINSHQLISTLINWYQLSSTDISSHQLISTLINWYQLSSILINFELVQICMRAVWVGNSQFSFNACSRWHGNTPFQEVCHFNYRASSSCRDIS